MKVKLFWQRNPLGGQGWFGHLSANAEAFEKEINIWLSNHPAIKIVEIKQSAHGTYPATSAWLISVWYEEQGA